MSGGGGGGVGIGEVMGGDKCTTATADVGIGENGGDHHSPSTSSPSPGGGAPSSLSVQSLRQYWSRRESGETTETAVAEGRNKNHHRRHHRRNRPSPPASPASRRKTDDKNGALEELRRRFLSNRDDTPPALRTLSPVRPTARPRRGGGGGGGGGGGRRPPSPRKRVKDKPPPKTSSTFPSAVVDGEYDGVGLGGGGGEDEPVIVVPIDRPDDGPPRRADSVSVHWRSWSDRRRRDRSSSTSSAPHDATAVAIATAAAASVGGDGDDDRTETAAASSAATTAVTVQDGVLIADAEDFFSSSGGGGGDGGGGGWNVADAATATNPPAATSAASPSETTDGATDGGGLNLTGVSTTAIADGDDSPRRRGWDTRSVHDDDFLNNDRRRKEREATVARMAELFGEAFGSAGPPPPPMDDDDDDAKEKKEDGGTDDDGASSSSSSSSSRARGDNGGGDDDGDDDDPYGRPHDDTRGLLHSDTDESEYEYEYEYEGPDGEAAAHRYHHSERNIRVVDDDEVNGSCGDADATTSSSCPNSVTHDSPTIVASGSGTTPGRPRPPPRPSSPPASPSSSRTRRRRDDAARRVRRRDRVRRYLLCKGGGGSGGIIQEGNDGTKGGGAEGDVGQSSSDEEGSDGSVVGAEEETDEDDGEGEQANPYTNLVDEDGRGEDDDDDSPGRGEEDVDDSPWKPTPQERDASAIITAAAAVQMTFASSDDAPVPAGEKDEERRPRRPKESSKSTTTPRLLASPSSDFHSRMEEKFRNRVAGGGSVVGGAGAGGGAGAASGLGGSAFAASSFSTPKKERRRSSAGSRASPSPGKKEKAVAVVVEAAGVSPEEEEHVQFMLKRMGMSPSPSSSISASGSGSSPGTPTAAAATQDRGEGGGAPSSTSGSTSTAGAHPADDATATSLEGSTMRNEDHDVTTYDYSSISAGGPASSGSGLAPSGGGGGGGGRSLDDIVDSASDLTPEQKARILRHARRQAQGAERRRSPPSQEVLGGGIGGGGEHDRRQQLDRAEQLRQFQLFQRRRREQVERALQSPETAVGGDVGVEGGDEGDGGAAEADAEKANDGGGVGRQQAPAMATPSPGQRRGVGVPRDASPGSAAAPSPSFLPSTPSSSSDGPPRTPSSTRRSPPAYHRGGGLYSSSTTTTGSVGSSDGRSSPRPPTPRSSSCSPRASTSSIKILDPSVAARLAAAGAMADSKFEKTLSASGSGSRDGDGLGAADGSAGGVGVIGTTSSSSMSSPSPSRSALTSTPTSSRPPLSGSGRKRGKKKKNVYQHDLSNLLSSQSPSIRYMLGGSCRDGGGELDDGCENDAGEEEEEESGAFDPAAILQACSPLQPTMSEDEEEDDRAGVVFDDEGHMDGATFTRGAMASWQHEEKELAERRQLVVDDGDGDAIGDDEASAETLVAWIESVLASERGRGGGDYSHGETGGVIDGGEVGRQPLGTYLTHDVLNDICRHVTRAANDLIHPAHGRDEDSRKREDVATRPEHSLVPFQVPTRYANPVNVVRSFTSWLGQISALTDVPLPPNHVLENLDNRVLVRHNQAPSPSSLAPEEKKEQACSTSTTTSSMVEDFLLPDEDVYAVPILSFMKRVCDSAAYAADAGPAVRDGLGLDYDGAAVGGGGDLEVELTAAAPRPDHTTSNGKDGLDMCDFRGREGAAASSRKSPPRLLDHSATGDDDDDADGTKQVAATAKSYVDELPPPQRSTPHRRKKRSSHRRGCAPPRCRELRCGPTPPKRAYETPPTTSQRTSTSSAPPCLCPLEAAMRHCPRVLSQILSFWGDPATVCRWKAVSKLCRDIIRRNEHDMMQDAVRVGGMDDHVRPSFWLWITLERCRASPHRPVLGYYHREGLDCKGHFCPPHLAIYEGEQPGGGGRHASPHPNEDGDFGDVDRDYDAANSANHHEHEVTSGPSSGEPLEEGDKRDGQLLATPGVPSRSASEMNLHSMVNHTYRRSLQDKLLNSDEFVDFSQLERMGSEGKWHSVISRDVARAFGTLPPHKTKQSGESQRDSIIRALVPTSWGGGGCGGEENGLGENVHDDWNDYATDDDATYAKESGSADGGGRCRRVMHHDEAAATTTTKGDTMVSDWGAVSGSSSSNLANGAGDINGHHHDGRTFDCRTTNGAPDMPSDEEEEERKDEHDLALSGILTPEIKVDLQNKLGSILHALAVAHPGVGYCQGMDYVVAHIMRVLQDTLLRRSRRRMLPPVLCKYNVSEIGDRGISSAADTSCSNDNNKSTLLVEEGVFLVVDTLFTTYNLRHTYWPELRCLKRTCRVFERLIERKLPVLADHFQHHELNVGLFALGWFQTLYLYLPSMPCATVCHMWDIWLVERSYKIFFRVGTAILFLSQPILLNQELEGMMTYLNTFPDATLLSPDILITCALQIKVTNRMLVEIEREVIDGLECQFS